MAQLLPGSNAYTYEPLKDFHSFRTLELFAGQSSEPLRGRLRTHSQDPFVTYEALSYAWGGPKMTNSIHIEDKELAITANLHHALVRLRRTGKPRVLWADGICINQKDSAEKSRQVRRMALYYQHAEQVIVYLGEAADGSEKVLSLIEKIHLHLSHVPPGLQISSTVLEAFSLPSAEDDVWEALGCLFLRPWWTRYWVIQEVIKGQNVNVFCGGWICPWDKFSNSIQAVNDHGLPFSNTADPRPMAPVRSGLRGLSNMSTLRLSMWQNPEDASWKLIDLLQRCRTSEASDDRDYIFAMTGLCVEAAGLRPGAAKDMNPEALDPNYTHTTQKTYIRFARHMVEWGDGIKVLYCASYGRETCELPSWVPNWAARDTLWVQLCPPEDGGPNYHFSAATSAHRFFKMSTVSDYLIVRGIIVDHLTKVGAAPSLEADDSWTRDINAVVQADADLVEFLEPFSSYPSQENLDDVIWKTLCCNVGTHCTMEAPHDFRDLYLGVVDFAQFYAAFSATGVSNISEAHAASAIEKCNEFLKQSAPFCLHRRRAIATAGWVAQVPLLAEPGDAIFIPLGSAVPFILRPSVDGYKLVGECYVHGLMKGEALKMESFSVQDVTLV